MPKLLQIWRVAEILDCSNRTVYNLIQQGKLAVVKLGERGIRVKQDSVTEYVKKNEVP